MLKYLLDIHVCVCVCVCMHIYKIWRTNGHLDKIYRNWPNKFILTKHWKCLHFGYVARVNKQKMPKE